MTHCSLGLDIGSVNVKACTLDGSLRSAVVAHEGHIEEALTRALTQLELDTERPPVALATGGEGRGRLGIPGIIAARAIEAGLEELGLRPRAVVCLGGEDLVVYTLDESGRILTSYAGNKCASGTGEFLRQQLGRMDLRLEDLDTVTADARVLKLSARCSVFMKSDCTHRLNKGEATRQDIALSLSRVMADKVGEFLSRARIGEGEVLLTGGVTQNRALVDFLRASWPKLAFLVPAEARFFEAFGAACLARTEGRPLLPAALRLAPPPQQHEAPFAPLATCRELVSHFPSRRGVFRPEAEYILGVDGGSTTTKVALVDAQTMQIVASHYGRTNGDPVGALGQCIVEILRALGDEQPKVTLCATTGSSRELLGVFLETEGVYNEIIAHTVGTVAFEPEVDTIFEIGGQDAKYVLLNNGVPIDYAMNEACSAGTGSFLEESAAGDLDIDRAEDIGPIALEAKAPLRFGEHCSAFINSDIRKAIQQGASRPDIVAGLVFSIVTNYANRVVGNRTIGERIALQGGVAKNPAIPLAFAQVLGKPICVPPDPELMGCYGVARLASQKHELGLLSKGRYDLRAILARKICVRNEFVCQACENHCPIRNLEVDGHRYPFGGRCSKFTGARRQRAEEENSATDWVAWRSTEMFERQPRLAGPFVARDSRTVGVPLALSVHSLWPLYSRFFHELGVRTVLSDEISPEGIAKQESSYCFPVEIAHGAIEALRGKGVDFLFLPHFRDMPSLEQGEVHACLCPLTQGLPYLARQAFGLGAEVLRPVVSFKPGWDACRGEFEKVAVQLGLSAAEGGQAFDRAVAQYRQFQDTYRAQGREILGEIRANPDRLYVALLGRPYNAFTRDANMGIPRKFTSRGVTVVPFDMIHDEDASVLPNMYWYYGQQDMRAVARAKELPNLYLTWISNFSCAPDSFMLHYLRWMMGQKPYLVLEIDSHTADAGLDTRIEAFLDIVQSYRRQAPPARPRREGRRFVVVPRGGSVAVSDSLTGDEIAIRDPRVTLLWPSFGDLATDALVASTRKQGVRSEALPVADAHSTHLARRVASGKECVPALIVLGNILQYLGTRSPSRPDEVLLVAVPSTLGPCRTGQYHVFYDRLFTDMGLENVALYVSGDEASYSELGRIFTRDLWRGVVLSDTFTDIRTAIRLVALDVDQAMVVFRRAWEGVLAGLTRGGSALDKALAQAACELSALPRRRSLRELKRVLIVGEIFVRRDNFSVGELSDHLIERDIFPKASDIAEWLHYTDWSRRQVLDEQVRRDGLPSAIRRGWLGERMWLGIESWWKQRVEHKVRQALLPTGLLPEAPDDVDTALRFGEQEFVASQMQSEATLSPAVAAAAMQDGYSGVVIIAPFGCLPGRVIEGVYAPWARRNGYPVVAVENDGRSYPPNVVARLDVFAHNVRRYERRPKLD